MRRVLRFVWAARKHGHAYIDIDGCLLHRMPIPAHVPPDQALDYWMTNLCKTRVIRSRLVLLYLLRALGVKLHVWTNRSAHHEPVTRLSLGRHYRLFSDLFYCGGHKRLVQRRGPCMDDEERNLGGHPADLLVKAPPHARDLMSLWTPPE